MTGTHAADPIHPAPRTPAPKALSKHRRAARHLPRWIRRAFVRVTDRLLRPSGDHHVGRADR